MSSIQKYQIQKERDKITKSILQTGREFDKYDIYNGMAEVFSKYTPGVPYYTPLHIEKFERSNKEVYNESFILLEQDLDAIYHSYRLNEINILSAKEHYDSNMYHIMELMSSISAELEIAKEYIAKNVPYNTYIINFFNLSHTNTKDLSKHNIQKTNCEIDFAKSLVCNKNISPPSAILNTSDATIYVNTNVDKITTDGDINNILDKNKLSMVSLKTQSSTSDIHEVVIDIDLKKQYFISLVELDAFNIDNDEISFYISQDGVNYYRKENIYTKKDIIWNFESMLVRYMRILFKKGNVTNVNNKKSSMTTITSLTISLASFNKNGIFVSEKARMYDASDVVIYPEHYIPPTCNILYFIGYEDKNNNVEWIPIKPEEQVDLGLFKTEELFATYMTSEKFGEWDFDRDDDNILFYIHALKNNNITSSLNIRAGYHQWLIERIDLSKKYLNGIPSDGKVNISDYSLKDVVAIAPLDMNINELRCEKEQNCILMSCFVLSEADEVITDRFIKYPVSYDENGDPIEIFDVKVIVNGKQVLPSKERYSFRLKKGENNIKIMILLCNHTYDLDDLDNTKTIVHNFNVLSTKHTVFAGPQMKRVSYNVINNSAHHFKLDQYAIKQGDDGVDYLITKFDPNYILSPHDPYSISVDDVPVPQYTPYNAYINNSEFMRMYIKYKYMPEKVKENITTEDGDSSIRLRLMAKLISKDKNTSPYINNIKVVTL